MTIPNLRGARSANNLSKSRPSTLLLAYSHYHPCKGALPSIPTRNLWRCSQQRYGRLNEHAQRRMEKYHRILPSKFRSRTSHLPRRPQAIHDEHQHTPWWNQGWGWGRFKSSFSRFPNGRPAEEFWEAERARTQQRMEQIKKAIDADPYGALFGRRLEPWTSLHNMENSISSLYRSVFGEDKTEGPKMARTTARPSATESPPRKPKSSVKVNETSIPSAPEGDDRGDLEFDPISGRMSPRKAGSPNSSRQDVPSKDMGERLRNESNLDSQHVGFLSAVEQPPPDAEKPVDTIMDTKATKREQDTTKQPPQVIHEDGEISTVDTEKVSHVSTQTPKMNDSVDASASELVNKRISDINTNGLLQSRGEVSSPEAEREPFEVESQEPQKSSPADVNTNGFNAQERFGPSGFIAQAGQKPAASSFADVSQQSEPIYSQERAEDLDLLRASDIRTPYYPPVSKRSKPGRELTEQRELDNPYNSHTDSVGYLDAHAIRQKFQRYQKPPPEDSESKSPIESALDFSEGQVVSQPPIGNETTKSRQGIEEDSSATQFPPSAISPSEVYQVLAYDPSTFKMTQAETSSSTSTSNKPLHPTEVLSLLNNPAKFMPYISKMHADGYEIVSGSGDVLVFRKELRVSHGQGDSSSSAQNIDSGVRNEPVFKESTFEHPTSAQEQETTDMGSSAPPSPNLSAPVEQSPVNSQNSSQSESKAGGPIRRMFIGGIATAATCYAIGVVSEYFRTGGQDGRGIDGFTAFESERRQREREENAGP